MTFFLQRDIDLSSQPAAGTKFYRWPLRLRPVLACLALH